MIQSAKTFKNRFIASIVARMFLQSEFLDFWGKVCFSREYKKNQRFVTIGKSGDKFAVEFHSKWGYVEESYLAEQFRQFLANKLVQEKISTHPEILKRFGKNSLNLNYLVKQAESRESLFSEEDDQYVDLAKLTAAYESFMAIIS